MKGYKEPSYQDRVGRAAEARRKALDQLKARPPIDEAARTAGREAALARQAAQAEKRAADKAAREQAAAEKAGAAEAAAQAERNGGRPVATEAERKAARDARYAARKSRR
jgi:uncharacterized protein DUF6481